jgi:hypothetical protein
LKLDNSPKKKTQNFSKHPISTKSSSSSRHCRQLFVSFKILSTLSTSLLQNFKQKSVGGGVLNNWGERLAQILCLWFGLQMQRTHYLLRLDLGQD